MKTYKKSKLGMFLKVLGSIFGIGGVVVLIFGCIKVNSVTNEFEEMIGGVLIIYAIVGLISALVTAGILWGIALVLDNQIKIESKLDDLYLVKDLDNKKIVNNEIKD